MQFKALSEQLEQFGLSENESALYLSLLQKNPQTAFALAKETAIPRATVYITLQSLEKKTIVASYKKNNVLYFLPESPSRFERLLEEKKKILDSIIPQMRGLISVNDISPSVKLYSGEDGARIVLDDIYDRPIEKGIREFLTISHPEFRTYFPKYLPEKLKEKNRLGIRTRLIAPESEKEGLPKEYGSDEFRETRFLPDEFPFQGTLIIYGNKTALFSSKDNEVYSVILESPIITNIFKQFFLFTWKMLGKGLENKAI